MNKLYNYIRTHGYSMRELSVKIGFKSQSNLRDVLVKRKHESGKVKQMSMDKWQALAKELKIGLVEVLELYETENPLDRS